MRVTCPNCRSRFDDQFRTTICPHETFPSNDGRNHFRHHPESALIPPDDCELALRSITQATIARDLREARDPYVPFLPIRERVSYLIANRLLRDQASWGRGAFDQYATPGKRRSEQLDAIAGIINEVLEGLEREGWPK